MNRSLKLIALSLFAGLILVACGPGKDTTPPTVTVTAPADGSGGVVGSPLTIQGTAEDDTTVERVDVLIDGNAVQSTAPTDGTWSYDWVPLEAGTFDISAQAFDAAGNSATADAVTVTVSEDGGTVSGVITRTDPAGEILTTTGTAELAPVAPGELFVTFRQGRPDVQLGATATVGAFTFEASGDFSFAGMDFEQLREYEVGQRTLGFYRVPGLDESATRTLVAQLRASAQVEGAYPNWILSTMAEPTDALYPMQAWHYEQLNLPAAWDTETGESERITVAVLDSGRYDHTDIDWAPVGANFVNWDGTAPAPAAEGPIDNPYTIPGGSDHGTHVAGTIGALTNNTVGVAGVNWNVELVPVKVLAASGSGSLNGIIEGMYWAAGDENPAYGGHYIERPAHVINLSLGGNISEMCPPIFDEFFQDIYAMSGTIAVVAAGNDSSTSDVYFPASCPSVITVGATGLTGERAYYSNFGPFVDVMAPGGDVDYAHPVDETFPAAILSTRIAYDPDTEIITPNFGFMQGTSMASPHVAGVVSLMLARDSSLGLEEVRERLHNASLPLSEAQCNSPIAGGNAGINVCGAGLLDAAAALLGESVTTPTAVAYAIPYEGEEAPAIGYSHLNSLELMANYRVEATELPSGDYAFDFGVMEPGKYLIVGLELRDAESSVSHIDRFGTSEAEVVVGGSVETTVVVEPIYLTLR